MQARICCPILYWWCCWCWWEMFLTVTLNREEIWQKNIANLLYVEVFDFNSTVWTIAYTYTPAPFTVTLLTYFSTCCSQASCYFKLLGRVPTNTFSPISPFCNLKYFTGRKYVNVNKILYISYSTQKQFSLLTTKAKQQQILKDTSTGTPWFPIQFIQQICTCQYVFVLTAPQPNGNDNNSHILLSSSL